MPTRRAAVRLPVFSTPELRAVLPFVVRGRALTLWVQLQWGVWASLDLGVEAERAFLEDVAEWCRTQRIDFIARP